MSRIVSTSLMGLALAGMLFVGATSAFGREGGGRGGGGGSRNFSGNAGRSFSGNVGRSFSGSAVTPRASTGNWTGRNWSGENRTAGNWDRGRDGRGWGDRDWGWRWNGSNWIWAIAPLVTGYGWGDGYYPGYYGYGYRYPYYDNYYDGNYDDYAQPSYSGSYTYSQPGYSTGTMMSGSQDQYLSQAIAAFQSGNYRDAERLAHHAVLDEQQNSQAHALLSIAAFAGGDDRTAADEAREVVNLGGVPSWSQIYAFYQDINRFTSHLRSLENVVKQDPKNADAQFLLGFLYLATGYRADAQEHLAIAAEQMPNDRVVANLLSEAGGQVPTTASRPTLPQGVEGSRTAPAQNIGQPPAAPTEDRSATSGNGTPDQPPAPPTENRGVDTSSGNPPTSEPPAPPKEPGRDANSDNSQAGPPAGKPPMAPTGGSSGIRPY
jgi:tetratricopeptide (TPR) repeat protein